MKKDRMTIYDIARVAGCSPASVSRAMNHPELVGSDTLDRIRKALNSEDFQKRSYRRPNVSGKREASGLYLLSIPSPGNPFYGLLIEGAASAAAEYGCRLLISYSSSDEDLLCEAPRSSGASLFDGMILMNGIDSRRLMRLADRLPVIQCSEYCEDVDSVSSVSIDDEAGIRKAAEHLISTGRRELAYVSCPAQMRYARRRLHGFRSACEASGISLPDSRLIILPQTGFAVAHSAALRLLAGQTRPDAIACSSDIYAIACLKAAFELGIRIPDDLSVIGFDDIPQATMTQIALTTIRQPRFQLGYTAFETLYREARDPSVRKQRIFLPSELIVRETTGMRRPS